MCLPHQTSYTLQFLRNSQEKIFPTARQPPSRMSRVETIPAQPLMTMEYKFANLISKLNFYKLIPYPMDNC